MNIIQTYYMSLLARAAYATIDSSSVQLWRDYQQSSRFDDGVAGAEFSETLSKWLFDPSTTSDVKFTVLTQTQNPNSSTHTSPEDSNLPSGLAATLFQESSTGHKVLAFRGTEFSSGWLQDVWGADVDIAFNGIAYGQILALYNYINTLKTPAGTAVTQYTFERSLFAPENKPYFTVSLVGLPIYYVSLAPSNVSAVGLGLIGAGEKISVTGHSLGGHLALAFSKIFPNLLEQAYVYDGAGVGSPLNPADANAFLSLFGVSQNTGFSSNITDVYAWPGFEVTATGLLGHPANRIPIFIETDGITTSHVIGELTDSLSLYTLFKMIDPTANENYLKVDRILQGTTDLDVKTNEVILHQLSKIYGINSTSYSSLIGENNFYVRYFSVLDAVRSAATGYVVDLSSLNQNQILAKTEDEYLGLAYAYALKNLNAFAIEGLDYNAFNQHHELDIYDAQTGQGTLTQSWIKDRAAMLGWMMQAFKSDAEFSNNEIRIGASLTQMPDTWKFKDVTSNKTVIAAPDRNITHYVTFGTETSELIAGGLSSDRLYGEGGSDLINGLDDQDYIEGGLGNDTLDAGEGNDTLIGGAGQDQLTGNLGDDSLDGGLGDDIFSFSTGQGSDTIQDTRGNNTLVINGQQNFIVNRLNAQDNVYVHQSTGNLFLNTSDGLSILLKDQGGSVRIKGWTQSNNFGITLDNEIATQLNLSSQQSPEYHIDTALLDSIIGSLSEEDKQEFAVSLATGSLRSYLFRENVTVIEPIMASVFQPTQGKGLIYNDIGQGSPQGRIPFMDAIKYANDTPYNPYGFEGADYADQITGFDGAINDVNTGASSHEILNGMAGNDLIMGQRGNDHLVGGKGSDTLIGGEGNDIIKASGFRYVNTGQSWAVGGLTNQELWAQQVFLLEHLGPLVYQSSEPREQVAYAQTYQADTAQDQNILDGGLGNDTLVGSEAKDIIYGGEDKDTLVGGAGQDVLDGGNNNDEIWGDSSISEVWYGQADLKHRKAGELGWHDLERFCSINSTSNVEKFYSASVSKQGYCER